MAGRYSITTIPLKGKKTVKVYASPKIGEALREISKDMTLYDGVRLYEVLEAVYVQGQKDGAHQAFEGLDRSLAEVKKVVPHRRPGRPRKK
jgi:sulfate adenylyltransferase subunit 1 (EFTu-like GTPase family)